MDLRKHISARTGVEIEIEEGFRVKAIVPLPAEWEKMEQACVMTYRNDELALQPDEEKQARVLAGFILDWDGLTGALCGRYLGMDLDGDFVPYTTSNARTLVEYSSEFRVKFVKKLKALSDLRARQRSRQEKN